MFGLLLSLIVMTLMLFSNSANALSLEIDLKKSINSANSFHELVGGVGYGFDPSSELIPKLKEINIKYIRLINVDYDSYTEVSHKKDGSQILLAPVLDGQLNWCKSVGAAPHIIIGQRIPNWLSIDGSNILYGPKDWQKYDDYIRLIMNHVIVERGFSNTSWEVGNEPDNGNTPVTQLPHGPIGGDSEYLAYLNIYRHIALIAVELEKKLGIKITLGGPAHCFRTSNFVERFIKDVVNENLKCDFYSFHYYGGWGAIGERKSLPEQFPPFKQLIKTIYNWMDKYQKRLPIWITEWGASSVQEMSPAGQINANNIGASWIAAFVHDMMVCNIVRSILLVTNDYDNNWAWQSLFHGVTPKPSYYIFKMFQAIQGDIVEVKGGSEAIDGIAARQKNNYSLLIWNYNWIRGYTDVGHESATPENVTIRFKSIPLKAAAFRIITTQISAENGNYIINFSKDNLSKIPLKRDLGVFVSKNGILEAKIYLPASSVILLEIFYQNN